MEKNSSIRRQRCKIWFNPGIKFAQQTVGLNLAQLLHTDSEATEKSTSGKIFFSAAANKGFMMETTGFDGTTIRGLVLAGGDGRRLQPYIQQVKGEKLPKQFVNFVGRQSMVEHTFRRVERLIPADQILTVVTRQHLLHPEVRRQLARRRSETVVVQPWNRETGPGILLPLAFIYKSLPEAIVALFPSDHFILEEERFMSYVTLAIQAVKHDPAQIILLAIEPHKPEPEYGYILPRENSGRANRFGTRPVSGFVEKPRPERAVELVTAGALWNTMTMVFKLRTLWQLVQRVHPVLYANFHRIFEAIGTAQEQRTVNEVYDALQPINFSREITEKIADHYPDSIAVLPVRDVFWSDVGSPERVLQVVRKLNRHSAKEVHALTRSKCWQEYRAL